MKPEPLKGKKRLYICLLTGKKGYKYFEDIDVKSAVEWYLIEQDKDRGDNKLYDEWQKNKSKLNYRAWLVLKAFEDVTKKTNEGENNVTS